MRVKKITFLMVITCGIILTALAVNGGFYGSRALAASARSTTDSIKELAELVADGDNYILSGGRDGSISVYAEDYSRKMDFCTSHKNEIHALAVAPDKKIFVTGDKDGKLIVWDLANYKTLVIPAAHRGDIRDIKFSQNGKFFATASKDRTIKIWDSKTLKAVKTLKGHKSYVTCVRFDPRDRILASVGVDNQLIIWDVKTGRQLKHKNNSHYRAVNQVEFSPDGKLIYTASSDSTIKIWNVKSLSCQNTLKGHKSEILSLALSPDGNTLFSAGRDKQLICFRVDTGKKVGRIELPNNLYVVGISFVEDGKTVCIGDISGELTMIDYASKKVITQRNVSPIYAMSQI
jgi:WD40 repeat protein